MVKLPPLGKLTELGGSKLWSIICHQHIRDPVLGKHGSKGFAHLSGREICDVLDFNEVAVISTADQESIRPFRSHRSALTFAQGPSYDWSGSLVRDSRCLVQISHLEMYSFSSEAIRGQNMISLALRRQPSIPI